MGTLPPIQAFIKTVEKAAIICEEAGELITALVDNELPPQQKKAMEGHLGDCPRCRVLYRREGELKSCLQRLAARVVAPAGLRERVLADARGVAIPTRPAWSWIRDLRTQGIVPRPVLALALLLFLALPVLYMLSPTGASIPLAAMEVHAQINSGDLTFTRDENAQQTATRLTRSVGNRFAPMGLDLSAAGLKPVGGMHHRLNDRDVLVAVYRGNAPPITCFTFIGTEEDAPHGARLFHDAGKKMDYYTFTNGTTNGVMHLVGERVCLLVSNMPMDELLHLARSAEPSIAS